MARTVYYHYKPTDLLISTQKIHIDTLEIVERITKPVYLKLLAHQHPREGEWLGVLAESLYEPTIHMLNGKNAFDVVPNAEAVAEILLLLSSHNETEIRLLTRLPPCLWPHLAEFSQHHFKTLLPITNQLDQLNTRLWIGAETPKAITEGTPSEEEKTPSPTEEAERDATQEENEKSTEQATDDHGGGREPGDPLSDPRLIDLKDHLELDVLPKIERAIREGLNARRRSCLTCEHWEEETDSCYISNSQKPPANIIANGCDKWQEVIPF